MPCILVAADKPFSKDATAQITALGATFPGHCLKFLQGYKTRDELYAAVAEVEALVVRSDKVDEELLGHAHKLKIVVRAGAGYDTIDLPACTKRNIVVMNTPGQNSNAVAEIAVGLAITALRRGYSGKSGGELKGRTLGLHAFGATARCFAAIARGFDMKVIAYDPFAKPEDAAKLGVKLVTDLKELYKSCSVISLHTPLKPETKGVVNAELLALMPADGLLINTARVEVVDEAALVEKMTACPGFLYAADVAPKCAAEMTEKFAERVAFSKIKCGAQTEEANTNCGTAAIRQIVGFLEKGDTTFQVNKAK